MHASIFCEFKSHIGNTNFSFVIWLSSKTVAEMPSERHTVLVLLSLPGLTFDSWNYLEISFTFIVRSFRMLRWLF